MQRKIVKQLLLEPRQNRNYFDECCLVGSLGVHLSTKTKFYSLGSVLQELEKYLDTMRLQWNRMGMVPLALWWGNPRHNVLLVEALSTAVYCILLVSSQFFCPKFYEFSSRKVNWIILHEVSLMLIMSHLSQIVHSLIFLCRKSREVRGKIKDGHRRWSCRFHWLFVRVTLVAAFGFLPQNFGRWWGSTNCHFAWKECSLSGSDNVLWQGHSNTTRW